MPLLLYYYIECTHRIDFYDARHYCYWQPCRLVTLVIYIFPPLLEAVAWLYTYICNNTSITHKSFTFSLISELSISFIWYLSLFPLYFSQAKLPSTYTPSYFFDFQAHRHLYISLAMPLTIHAVLGQSLGSDFLGHGISFFI